MEFRIEKRDDGFIVWSVVPSSFGSQPCVNYVATCASQSEAEALIKRVKASIAQR